MHIILFKIFQISKTKMKQIKNNLNKIKKIRMYLTFLNLLLEWVSTIYNIKSFFLVNNLSHELSQDEIKDGEITNKSNTNFFDVNSIGRIARNIA